MKTQRKEKKPSKRGTLGVEMPWDDFVGFAKIFGFDLEAGIPLGNGQSIGVKVRPPTAAERAAAANATRPAWARTLGIKSGWHRITREQLNSRRRDLAKKYHPDGATAPKDIEARTKKLREINQAFDQACIELGLND